jgi:hypothetical protein
MKVFPHCTENSKHIFPEVKLRGLVSNFYIHVFGCDLYVPTIGLILNLYFTVLPVRTLCLPQVSEQFRAKVKGVLTQFPEPFKKGG